MAKEGSRNNKYRIEDNFLNFWFRFIYKYRSAIEISNLHYVRDIVERDYSVYSGLILEKYFRSQMIESRQYSTIQGYWNSKNENEIDIIGLNEMEKRIIFCEVKRNRNKINMELLQTKATEIAGKFSSFTKEYKGLSLDDM